MKNTIIQWNCRGLRANYDELQLLLNDYDPAVVCLQETYLKEPNNVTFRNYNLFNTSKDKLSSSTVWIRFQLGGGGGGRN